MATSTKRRPAKKSRKPAKPEAIAQRLTELTGGQIEFEYQPGTLFTSDRSSHGHLCVGRFVNDTSAFHEEIGGFELVVDSRKGAVDGLTESLRAAIDELQGILDMVRRDEPVDSDIIPVDPEPLRVAILRGGKVERFVDMDDPRQRFCETFNCAPNKTFRAVPIKRTF